jgi:hypothetical protein
MVNQSVGKHSKITEQVYITAGCLQLEYFFFCSLYLFSCIANNTTTLENILTLVLAPFLG